jgi:hypothetical protein
MLKYGSLLTRGTAGGRCASSGPIASRRRPIPEQRGVEVVMLVSFSDLLDTLAFTAAVNMMTRV